MSNEVLGGLNFQINEPGISGNEVETYTRLPHDTDPIDANRPLGATTMKVRRSRDKFTYLM